MVLLLPFAGFPLPRDTDDPSVPGAVFRDWTSCGCHDVDVDFRILVGLRPQPGDASRFFFEFRNNSPFPASYSCDLNYIDDANRKAVWHWEVRMGPGEVARGEQYSLLARELLTKANCHGLPTQ